MCIVGHELSPMNSVIWPADAYMCRKAVSGQHMNLFSLPVRQSGQVVQHGDAGFAIRRSRSAKALVVGTKTKDLSRLQAGAKALDKDSG